jgi:UDP-glucose 4-epimerase
MDVLSAALLPARPQTSGRSVHRAAVVGADGFIGRRLTAALCATGAQVTAYSRQHELRWPDDPAAPGIVFYLASSITPTLAEQHPEWVTADHLRFTDLVRRLARSARPPTVVLTSSAGTVYDPDVRGPCPEEAATRSTSRYGAAKLALERLLLDHAGVVPAVVLRLSNVYGPGQRVGKLQGVLAYWLLAAARGDPLDLIGDPLATRDYVYIDDVVDCMVRTVAAATDGPLVLNVASGVSTSLASLLSTVESVVGRELPVRHLPHRPVDRPETCLDVRRAARLLGWRPGTPLAEGIDAMWRETRSVVHSGREPERVDRV